MSATTKVNRASRKVLRRPAAEVEEYLKIIGDFEQNDSKEASLEGSRMSRLSNLGKIGQDNTKERSTNAPS